ncbi:enoyl-CoA hydratase/carnithine racemase [Clostridium beijerinckii]|nr:enoyl-CoA hydratase/carnithine racemase [Clostridium beijerinckii]
MELKNVILEKEGHLAIVTINRPKALNALNSETLKDLDAVLEDLEKRQQYVYSYRYWCW